MLIDRLLEKVRRKTLERAIMFVMKIDKSNEDLARLFTER